MTASIAVADATQRWTVQTLYNALQQDNLVKSGEAKLEMLAGADSVINVTMTEVGELPIQVSVAGEIIVAQVMLWERSLVKDPAAFHESVMVAEKMFELANISLDQLSNGTWVYVMYGSLRSTTALVDIIFELQTLAVNVIEAAEAFSDHLV